MRERLLKRVRKRVDRCFNRHDRAAVLAPEAVADAQALLDTVPDDDYDVEVAHAAGWLFYLRFLQLILAKEDEETQQQALSMAIGLLEPLAAVNVRAVPKVIRFLLGGEQPAEPAEPEVIDAVPGITVLYLPDAIRSQDPAALERGILMARRSLAVTPADHPHRPAILDLLGMTLVARFKIMSSSSDLEEALDLLRAAVATAAAGADIYAHARSSADLCHVLGIRFDHAGDPDILDEAVNAGRTAVSLTSRDDPDRATYLAAFAGALHDRFECSGQDEDLEAAIVARREVLDLTSEDDPEHADHLTNLGVTLITRFERVGQVADLEAGIAHLGTAVIATSEDDEKWPAILANLSNAVRMRYDSTGDAADLEKAVRLGRAAVAAAQGGAPARAQSLGVLATALQHRYERTGSLTDLDQAVETARTSVAAAPAGHPDHAIYTANLALMLRIRFERTGNQADLDQAVTAARAVVAATPADHPRRGLRLANLGVALRMRSGTTGYDSDLDEAVTMGRASVAATPADHPDRGGHLNNLGATLAIRFRERGDLADVNEAVEMMRAALAVKISEDHPDRLVWLSNLGITLHRRFTWTGHESDLDEAVTLCRNGAELKTAPPAARMWSALAWGRAAATGHRWAEAVAGFTTAADLLSRAAPRALARRDQEYQSAQAQDLGSDAVACCVHAGLPSRAVELFDQSRGVLLGQALDTRTDLTSLAAAYPDIAARFVALRDRLGEAGSGEPFGPQPRARARRDASEEDDQRKEAAAAFEKLIDDIRELPGLGAFLRPPSQGELAAAAAHGTIAIVSVSAFGSYSLLITADGAIEPVPLPLLTSASLRGRADAFFDALARVASGAAGPDAQMSAERAIADTLDWLWDVVTGPVLDRLGIGAPPGQGQAWPRVWWCVSGLLSFLPLHAAGRHHTRFDAVPDTVIDRVRSSYTPTVRALVHARRTHAVHSDGDRASLGGGQVLAVAMPHTPGLPGLPGASAEATGLQHRLGSRVTVLTGPHATHEAVLAALPGARWAHFACHASADPTNPSASHLLLTDHQTRPLTVVDVARLRLDDAELAFLSACATARPGRLPDEAIHLASAFQLAGYRHVIGTLWPIGDQPALGIATDIYASITETGDVAGAVHEATRRLRDRWADMPSVWASHIHVGA
jgi:hypothetical protein